MVLSLGQAPQPLSICHSFWKVAFRRLDWQPSPKQSFFRVPRNNSLSMHSDQYIESLILTPIKHFLIKGIYCMGLPTKKKNVTHHPVLWGLIYQPLHSLTFRNEALRETGRTRPSDSYFQEKILSFTIPAAPDTQKSTETIN